jgi:hypothetical protein
VAGSRDHAIEYRFGKLSRFVAAHGNQKQIEEAEGVVFQGLNPLRKKPASGRRGSARKTAPAAPSMAHSQIRPNPANHRKPPA